MDKAAWAYRNWYQTHSYSILYRTGGSSDSCVARDDNDEGDFLEVDESPKKKHAREL
jgi:hypothetical protein